jgi:hypothetical protein
MEMPKKPMGIKETHEFMKNLPVEKFGDYEVRAVQWGDMNVSFEKAGSDFDVTPYLKGLPDNLDQSHHWGFVFKGEFITKYEDHEETVKAEQAYFTMPGHTTIVKRGTELLEFTPLSEAQKLFEVIGKNLAMQKK